MGNLESTQQKITNNNITGCLQSSDIDDDEPDDRHAVQQSDAKQHHGGRRYTSQERAYARLASLDELDLSEFRNIFPKHIIRRSRCAYPAPQSPSSATPQIDNIAASQTPTTAAENPDEKDSQSTTDVPEGETKEFVMAEQTQEVMTTTQESGIEPTSRAASLAHRMESPTSQSTSPSDLRSRRSRKLSRKLMDSLEAPLEETGTKKRRVM